MPKHGAEWRSILRPFVQNWAWPPSIASARMPQPIDHISVMFQASLCWHPRLRGPSEVQLRKKDRALSQKTRFLYLHVAVPRLDQTEHAKQGQPDSHTAKNDCAAVLRSQMPKCFTQATGAFGVMTEGC